MCLMFNVKTNKGWQSVYLLTEVYGSERKSPRFLWRQRWVRLCSSNLIMVLWLVKHNTCLVLTVFLSTWWYMNRILKPLFLGKNAKYLRYLILCLLWIMHWESWPNVTLNKKIFFILTEWEGMNLLPSQDQMSLRSSTTDWNR